jgi:hypothetical protein
LDVDKGIQGIVAPFEEAQLIKWKTKSARMDPRPEKFKKKLGMWLLYRPDTCCLKITPEFANICLNGGKYGYFEYSPVEWAMSEVMKCSPKVLPRGKVEDQKV